MSLRWSIAEVSAAVDRTSFPSGDDVAGAARITGVGIDSRTVLPGDLFVAIAGDRFDGHDFVDAALERGAVAAVVRRGAASSIDSRRVIEVDDTGVAFRDLAALRRSELTTPVIAVTGSTGKTSTKDLLATALPGATASLRSFNNEVGVPLTVLGAPAEAGYLVLEVGAAGPGHIEWLAPAIRPDVAIITNLGVAHLATFGTTDALADTKFELVDALSGGGTAVLPYAETRLHRAHRGGTLTFGHHVNSDISVGEMRLDEGALPSFRLDTPAGSVRVRLPVAGAHNALNAAAAVGAGLAVGVPIDVLATGLEAAKPSPWRMEIHQGRFTVVNDAYNANPDSVRAALRTVAAMTGRPIAVLGRMAELGPVEAEEHRRMGAEARRLGFEAVVVVGEDPGYAEGAGDLARIAPDVAAAEAMVRGLVRPGDVVLVKASRIVGLEELALRLAEAAGE